LKMTKMALRDAQEFYGEHKVCRWIMMCLYLWCSIAGKTVLWGAH
jgi:hypothetical protein